jgi:hypothetical protein
MHLYGWLYGTLYVGPLRTNASTSTSAAKKN